jgi:PAS domain S-box-containing protein
MTNATDATLALSELAEGDRLQLMVQSIRDYAIFMVGPDGRIASWNPGAERIHGHAREEVLGSGVERLYTDEDRRAGKPAWELGVAKAESRYESQGWRLRKDGTRLWAHVAITALVDEAGIFRGYGVVTRDVTEQRIAEAVLRENEERHRLFISSVRDYALIFLSPDGIVASWNEGAQRLKGYAPDEVIGRHMSLFYTPEDAASGKAEHELKVASEQGRFEEEGWRVRKDGSRFRANVILTPVRDGLGMLTGYAKITRDITVAKAVEDALRLSEEHFRMMLDSIYDYAVFTLTPEGLVASWNPGAQRIKGYKPEEIIGQHFSRFYPQADAASGKAERELDVARREGRYAEEGWRIRKDGSAFWASVVLSVQRDAAGVVRGFTKVTRDMTETKRASDALLEMTRRLRRSNLELERFASVASHDLQEPLRKILAFGDQLTVECRDQLGDDGRFYVDRMAAAAQRMRTLIDDLLAFSRVTSRPRKPVQVDLGEVLRGVLSDLEARTDELRAEIRVKPLPTIEADATQMRQLLQNLVGNALKFHRPGVAPVVEIEARPAGQSKRGATWHEIVVRDNGIGFEDKYRERIFNLFERLHTREEYEGTGLGLSICRRIVEQHGGTIAVTSRPGEGSEFVATLPARATAERSDTDGST